MTDSDPEDGQPGGAAATGNAGDRTRARSVFDRARGRTENPIADPAGNARPHRRAMAPRSRSQIR